MDVSPPISWLPTEIWRQIFLILMQLCLADGGYNPWKLWVILSVCRGWHNLALDTSELWTHIDISVIHWQKCMVNLPRYLARSGNASLDVYIDGSPWQNGVTGVLDGLGYLLAKHSGRLRTFHCVNVGGLDLQALLKHFCIPAPRLVDLVLDATESRGPWDVCNLFGNDTPNLLSMFLTNVPISIWTYIPRPHLTTLSLDMCDLLQCAKTIVPFLRENPSLESLSLCGFTNHDSRLINSTLDAALGTRPIYLNKLKELTLRSLFHSHIGRILNALVFPSTTYLNTLSTNGLPIFQSFADVSQSFKNILANADKVVMGLSHADVIGRWGFKQICLSFTGYDLSERRIFDFELMEQMNPLDINMYSYLRIFASNTFIFRNVKTLVAKLKTGRGLPLFRSSDWSLLLSRMLLLEKIEVDYEDGDGQWSGAGLAAALLMKGHIDEALGVFKVRKDTDVEDPNSPSQFACHDLQELQVRVPVHFAEGTSEAQFLDHIYICLSTRRANGLTLAVAKFVFGRRMTSEDFADESPLSTIAAVVGGLQY